MKHRNDPSLPLFSDEDILALYEARNERAIAETDRKYRALLWSVARGILPDERDREEALNDAYLRVWNAIPPARPASLRAYLVQVLRRVAIDRYYENRGARRVPPELTDPMEDYADLLSGGDAPDEGVHAEAVGRLISDFLRRLPRRRRYIFMERFYCKGAVPDIARALGMTESAVYKELSRTKRELKEYLAKNGVYV